MSCAVIFTRAPRRPTSTTASTPSSFAISGSDFEDPLNRITEVRDVTRSDEIFASAVISSSVMPSAK
jgi:hypothetical protein